MLDLISFHRFYFIFHMNLRNNASYTHLLCTTQTAANIHCSHQCGLRDWPLSARVPLAALLQVALLCQHSNITLCG